MERTFENIPIPKRHYSSRLRDIELLEFMVGDVLRYCQFHHMPEGLAAWHLFVCIPTRSGSTAFTMSFTTISIAENKGRMFILTVANSFANDQSNGTEQYRKSQRDMEELSYHYKSKFEQLGFQATPYKDVPTSNFLA